jgi:hypothetical protein
MSSSASSNPETVKGWSIHMKRRICALAVVCAASWVISDSSDDYMLDPCLNEGKKPRVLIAVQRSAFKDSVKTDLLKRIEEDSLCIKVIPIASLKNEVPENYKAMLLINECRAGSLNANVKLLIEKATEKQKKRIVLVITSGDGKWKFKDASIDAVTSASKMKLVPATVDSLSQKLRNVIEQHR